MDLPTGTVTFFFTDIEGSTGLLHALGHESYGRLQDEHSAILRAAIDQGNGVEIRTEGDAFFAVFGSPAGAALAATDAQKGLAAYAWPDGSEIRVRIGMHTGEGSLGGDDYLGIDVNRAARIAAVGHGGQVVVSAATAGLIEQTLPDGVVLRDLGLHRLKDFPDPLRLHDLVIPGLPSDFAQLRTLDARPTNLPTDRTSFVGRAEEVARLEEMLGEGRMVTLVGPGGAGKTRLAIHVASQMLDRFTEGAFLVDLSAVTDASVVLPEIAAALKVRREPGQERPRRCTRICVIVGCCWCWTTWSRWSRPQRSWGSCSTVRPDSRSWRRVACRSRSRASSASRCSPCRSRRTMPPTRDRSTPSVSSPSEPLRCIPVSRWTSGRRPPWPAS